MREMPKIIIDEAVDLSMRTLMCGDGLDEVIGRDPQGALEHAIMAYAALHTAVSSYLAAKEAADIMRAKIDDQNKALEDMENLLRQAAAVHQTRQPSGVIVPDVIRGREGENVEDALRREPIDAHPNGILFIPYEVWSQEAPTIAELPRGPVGQAIYDEDRDEMIVPNPITGQVEAIRPGERSEWLGTVEWRGPASDYWPNAPEINRKLAAEASKLFNDTRNNQKETE